jgi:hypothetical protein
VLPLDHLERDAETSQERWTARYHAPLLPSSV